MRVFMVGIFLASLFMLGACSIRQEVQPMTEQPENTVCIIEKPAVREGVLQTLQEVLQEKGYHVRVIAPGSAVQACPLTVTYHATWQWDLANYIGHARIEVFRDGRRVGQAEYDARSGAANMKKFVNGRTKIRELVEQVFVGVAGMGQNAAPPAQAPSPEGTRPGTTAPPAVSAPSPTGQVKL